MVLCVLGSAKNYFWREVERETRALLSAVYENSPEQGRVVLLSSANAKNDQHLRWRLTKYACKDNMRICSLQKVLVLMK
jgi:hypothetical protein